MIGPSVKATEGIKWWLGRLLPDPAIRARVGAYMPPAFPAVAAVRHTYWSSDRRTPLGWDEVAQRFGVPVSRLPTPRHDAGTDDYYDAIGTLLHGPTEGLDPLTARSLVDAVLEVHPDSARVAVGRWVGYSAGRVVRLFPDAACVAGPGREYACLEAAPEDLLRATDFGFRSSVLTGIWLDRQRRWSIHTEVDGYVTYAAGEPEFIAALGRSEALDVVTVDFNDSSDNAHVRPHGQREH